MRLSQSTHLSSRGAWSTWYHCTMSGWVSGAAHSSFWFMWYSMSRISPLVASCLVQWRAPWRDKPGWKFAVTLTIFTWSTHLSQVYRFPFVACWLLKTDFSRLSLNHLKMIPLYRMTPINAPFSCVWINWLAITWSLNDGERWSFGRPKVTRSRRGSRPPQPFLYWDPTDLWGMKTD